MLASFRVAISFNGCCQHFWPGSLELLTSESLLKGTGLTSADGDVSPRSQGVVRGGRHGGPRSYSHPKLYPTTSRRCSDAFEAYARTGDLEAAAALLTDLGDGGGGGPGGGSQSEPPPEKERRRMAVVVSCVALVISILAVAMVGVTLGLSHMMETERVGGEFFAQKIQTSK